MVEYVKGSYAIFENSYIPACELGINQAGKNTELSKEFITTVLSQDVQKEDLWDGFPVNKEAMKLGLQEDLSDYSFATAVRRNDGSEDVHTFGAISEQYKQDLAERYDKISNRIVKNTPVLLFLKDEIKEFLDGNLSVETAADRIMERANVYLSE
jgi:hypothetical protein